MIIVEIISSLVTYMIGVLVESAAVEEGSCVTVKVRAESLGHTVVSIVYHYLETRLEASVTIAAYKPLRVRLCLKKFI